MFLASSLVNILLVAGLLFVRRHHDVFEPVKLFAVLYSTAFALLPVWLRPAGAYNHSYFGGGQANLLDAGASLALAGLVLSLMSWWFVIYLGHRALVSHVGPDAQMDKIRPYRILLTAITILLFIAGAWSYIALVRGSGGFYHFLTYTGARSEIFDTFGGYYWGIFFLISSLCLFGAVHMRQSPRAVAAAAVTCFCAFALFQGRDLAIAPLFCLLIFYHYRVKALGLKKILIISLCLVTLASLMREYRASDKDDIHGDRIGFGANFVENYSDNIERTLGSGVEHLDSFMVALRFIETGGEIRRGATLIAWLNPIFRLMGSPTHFQDAGQILDYAANPGHRGFPTAITPSLKGELVLNFGVVGMLLGMLIYGAVLGVVHLISRMAASGSDISLALLPYTLWIVVKVPIDGSHLLFKLAVVITPLVIASTAVWFTRFVTAGSSAVSSRGSQA